MKPIYCERCRKLTVEKPCPVCGSNRLRPVNDDDFCLLTEREAIWAKVLLNTLESEGVPHAVVPVRGAGLTSKIGSGAEFLRVYVPYESYTHAQELLALVFAGHMAI